MLTDHVTIMTRPIPTVADRLVSTFRRVARFFWYAARLRNVPQRPEFGGHPAVTRSLVDGLTSLGLPFNLDPTKLDDVGHSCHVLSDVQALAQATKWKRNGRIRRLTAGPNLVVLPSEYPDLMAAPEIDRCVVNSAWIRDLYEADLPALAGRCSIWPAGVDVDYWTPDLVSKDPPSALIYIKSNRCGDLVEEAEHLLSQAGLVSRRIVYGSYGKEEFRAALRSARIAIFFSDHESQGIALAEAWACNVPTLVWESATFMADLAGRPTNVRTSSAPFLTTNCGLKFAGLRDLPIQLEAMLADLAKFRAREWTVKEMSDSATSAVLWKIVQGEAGSGEAQRTFYGP